MLWSSSGRNVKLYKPPKKKPEAVDLKRLVHGFQLVSTALVSALKANHVVSDDELESVINNVQDTLETVSHVLSRVLSLTESTDLHRMDKVELSVKFNRQQNDILYMVDIASVMLDRLYNLQYIGEKDHETLTRYWRSIPREHQRLLERWERTQ